MFYQALLYFLFCLQGSQGYGSTESDFVDMDGFQSMQDTTSLPELNLVGQVRIISDQNFTNVETILNINTITFLANI